jgi:hypothetical protein
MYGMPKFTGENISCGNSSIPVAQSAFSLLSQNPIDSRLEVCCLSAYLTRCAI